MIKRSVKSAVVTGPTGAIGVALCKKLLEKDIEVWAVCRPDSHRISVLPSNDKLHIVMCDIKELLHLPKLISEKQDVFFHFAWEHTIGLGRNDMRAQIENIQYTIDAVQSASALNCQVFIGAGSQAEYGRVEGVLHSDTPCRPENGYGMAKLCAGQMSRVEAEKSGIEHIWSRILSVYGPYDGPNTMISGTVRKLLSGEVPALTRGEQIWDYLYSGDAADAFYKMALYGRNCAVYPLGSGTVKPLREYIEILRDAIDSQLMLGFGQNAYGNLQVMHLQADIGELQKDTGFIPHTEFSEGIRKTIEWIRSGNNE